MEWNMADKPPQDPGLENPGVYANRFYVTVGATMSRISFGEQVAVDGESVYHQAIVLLTSDAKILADTIYGLLERVTPELMRPAAPAIPPPVTKEIK